MARVPFHLCTEARVPPCFGNETRPRERRPPVIAVAQPRSIQMLDFVMLALGLGFFASSVAYAYACDWL